LRGRKPANDQRSLGSPEATSAVVTALGPGSTSTSIPPAMHSRTSAKPGSEINGVPASDTSAMSAPARIRCASARARPFSLCSCRLTSDASIAWRSSSCRVCLVSSQAIASACASAASTRSVTSCRLPIGVGHTRSRPAVTSAVLISQI